MSMSVIAGILITFGIYLVCSDSINYVSKDFTKVVKEMFHLDKKSSLERYIFKIFMVISEEGKEKRDMNIFFSITSTLLIVSFYVLLSVFRSNAMEYGENLLMKDYATVFFLSLLLAMLPFAYIRTKLVLVQRAGSFEGEVFLKELFTQYKLANNNIITAILETVKSEIMTNEAPITKKALYHLSLKIMKIKTDAELQEALDDFVYAINTNWIKILANDFYSAIRDKTDIYFGLEDQLENCKLINESLEADKRGNLESMIMINYLTPFFIVFLTKMALEMMPLEKLVEYQFHTTTGIKNVCLITISIVSSYITTKLLTKPKYDV